MILLCKNFQFTILIFLFFIFKKDQKERRMVETKRKQVRDSPPVTTSLIGMASGCRSTHHQCTATYTLWAIVGKFSWGVTSSHFRIRNFTISPFLFSISTTLSILASNFFPHNFNPCGIYALFFHTKYFTFWLFNCVVSWHQLLFDAKVILKKSIVG
jgi:hypothetical protein